MRTGLGTIEEVAGTRSAPEEDRVQRRDDASVRKGTPKQGSDGISLVMVHLGCALDWVTPRADRTAF